MQDYHIDDHYMVIVGRYLETSRDFVNLTRVSRRYRHLIEIYRYNPISDPSLFANMKTQHFYESDDYAKYYNGDAEMFMFWKMDDDQIAMVCDNDIEDRTTVMRFRYPLHYDGPSETVDLNETYYTLTERMFRNDARTKNVTIHSCTVLPDYCFSSSNVSSVTLPKNLAALGERCFSHCKHLKIIELPRTLSEIPRSCFEDCSMKRMTIPYGVRTIASRAFAKTIIRDLYIPYSLNHVEQDAFEDAEILNIHCTKAVKKVIDKAIAALEKKPKYHVYEMFFGM